MRELLRSRWNGVKLQPWDAFRERLFAKIEELAQEHGSLLNLFGAGRVLKAPGLSLLASVKMLLDGYEKINTVIAALLEGTPLTKTLLREVYGRNTLHDRFLKSVKLPSAQGGGMKPFSEIVERLVCAYLPLGGRYASKFLQADGVRFVRELGKRGLQTVQTWVHDDYVSSATGPRNMLEAVFQAPSADAQRSDHLRHLYALILDFVASRHPLGNVIRTLLWKRSCLLQRRRGPVVDCVFSIMDLQVWLCSMHVLLVSFAVVTRNCAKRGMKLVPWKSAASWERPHRILALEHDLDTVLEATSAEAPTDETEPAVALFCKRCATDLVCNGGSTGKRQRWSCPKKCPGQNEYV